MTRHTTHVRSGVDTGHSAKQGQAAQHHHARTKSHNCSVSMTWWHWLKPQHGYEEEIAYGAADKVCEQLHIKVAPDEHAPRAQHTFKRNIY